MNLIARSYPPWMTLTTATDPLWGGLERVPPRNCGCPLLGTKECFSSGDPTRSQVHDPGPGCGPASQDGEQTRHDQRRLVWVPQ